MISPLRVKRGERNIGDVGNKLTDSARVQEMPYSLRLGISFRWAEMV